MSMPTAWMDPRRTIGATLLPFELVVFGVPRPRGAKAHQLSCDVGETPLQTPWTLLPHVAVGKEQTGPSGRQPLLCHLFFFSKTHLKSNKEKAEAGTEFDYNRTPLRTGNKIWFLLKCKWKQQSRSNISSIAEFTLTVKSLFFFLPHGRIRHSSSFFFDFSLAVGILEEATLLLFGNIFFFFHIGKKSVSCATCVGCRDLGHQDSPPPKESLSSQPCLSVGRTLGTRWSRWSLWEQIQTSS